MIGELLWLLHVTGQQSQARTRSYQLEADNRRPQAQRESLAPSPGGTAWCNPNAWPRQSQEATPCNEGEVLTRHIDTIYDS